MSDLLNLETIVLTELREGVRAREVVGERMTFTVIELAANATVPEHRHEHEQIGMVIVGRVRFRIDDETRDLGPGGIWRILTDHPHEVTAGPEGAVVVEVFSPVRTDWDDRERTAPRAPVWPPAASG